MNRKTSLLVACVLLAASAGARAQAVVPPPQNVLQLSASASVEVQQDLLQLQLTTAKDGADPAVVQSQLKAAVDAALAEARKAAQPGQLDVRTGNFALYPRHSREGRITGWTGSAEVVLEGRDFARITQTAARIQGMTLGGVSFALSREQRAKVESEAQQQAIQRFQARAGELAKGFGFSGYTLREVAVDSAEPGFAPKLQRAGMLETRQAVDTAPLPVEAGKSTVTITVSGSVQLR